VAADIDALQRYCGGRGARHARIPLAVQKFSTQQTHIDAPVDIVWDLVGDPNRHPDWWPRMVDVDCPELHEGCRYRGVVKGIIGADEHELLVERLELETLDGCREVSIFCEGTGVATRFMLTEAQGGTFVEARFSVDPASIGMRALTAVAGRRFLRNWLENSLGNLKAAAERAPSPA
jgi:uncharacterized protein YndB with AHSA1/START domain